MSSKTTSSRSSLPSNPTSLVLGYLGEVGSAIYEILREHYDEVAGVDAEGKNAGYTEGDHFDVLHVCIPWYEEFENVVRDWQHALKPKVTIIHSTVPVGVSRSLGAVHSPIRGVHPNLKEGIRSFKKFLGGEQASLVADYFRRAGIQVILVDKPETTEAGKLFDTEYYRAVIEFAHRVGAYCDEHGLNFHEVYTLFNQTYNEGYTKLGMPEVVRPVLQNIKGPIGGHCVMPNKELL